MFMRTLPGSYGLVSGLVRSEAGRRLWSDLRAALSASILMKSVPPSSGRPAR